MPLTTLPSLPFLMECSESAIQDLELKSLDLAAASVKRARAEMAQAVSYREVAGICRFLIEHRNEMIDFSRLIADGHQRLLKFDNRTGA